MPKKFSLDILVNNLLFDLEKIQSKDDKIRFLKINIKKIIQIKNGSDTILIND